MIRPLRPEDAEELAAAYLANREFLAPFEPVRPPAFFTAEGQRERLRRQLEREAHPFAILDAGAIAGTINLFGIDSAGLRSGFVGYWIDRARNGRGLATGAVGELLAYAFGELDLHRIEAATLVDNAPSQRVLEKNRFERIGLARSYLRINGVWRDAILFQRLADD